MRFVWAVAAFVLAALMIGVGIAQRTVFQGPDTETAALSLEEDTPYVLVEGDVLNSRPGSQTLRAQGEGTIFAAYGRTADLEAWLSDTPYTRVTVDQDGALEAEEVTPSLAVADETDEGSTPAPEESAAPEGEAAVEESAAGAEESADEARSPVGSDLWLDEFQQEDVLIAPLQLPEEMSVLVAADGAEPAPADITVSWPIANATPWAGPLIVAGGVMMAVGVFLYILAIRHLRRSRGPRRKGLPVPVTEPIDLAVEGKGKGVISASGRRALTGGRRRLIVVPAVAVSALLFAGCSSEAWPQFAPSPSPTPSASVIVPEGQQAPVVTEAQADRIWTRIAETVAAADEAADETLAATRLDGAVLAARSTNYALRAAIGDYPAPAALPAEPLTLVLPQAYDEWPRSIVGVVDDTAANTSSIMMLTQQDQWSPYKLTYLASLEAATELPVVAPAYIGAVQPAPDSPFLLLPPAQLAEAYADILNAGEESQYYDLFDVASDQFRVSVAGDRQKRLDEFNQTGASTGELTFQAAPGSFEPRALATLESGAIVAVNIDEIDTVKPTNPDAVIKLENNPTVRTLSGAEQSPTGFTTTYTDQLFFYVPGQGSTEKIRLLGYASDILNAKVIP
ncbi:glycosyl transferase [Microbacterium kunmingense]|uniref:glycosyl transferase n=1 Tax=Microbacterium kunmingense TaxID=2915939 RepID=UPI0020039C26|nr:glycosyl transferase [Microbacterium kunmingense]